MFRKRTLLKAFQKLIYMKLVYFSWPTIWNIPLNGSQRGLVNTLSELLFMNLKVLATILHICHYFLYIDFMHVSVIILNDKYFRKSLIYCIFPINSILGNKNAYSWTTIFLICKEKYFHIMITFESFIIVELLWAWFSSSRSFCE